MFRRTGSDVERGSLWDMLGFEICGDTSIPCYWREGLLVGTYIFKRTLSSIPVVIFVSMFVFSMMHMLPGDPLMAMVEEMPEDPVAMEALRERMGLNDPVYVQYIRWAGRAVRGDLGQSFRSRLSVTEMIVSRWGPTLQLAMISLTISIIFGVSSGVIASLYRSLWVDNTVMVGALFFLSMPNFWLGLMAIILFSHNLGWLPSIGMGTWQHLIMPGLTMGLSGLGTLSRLTRSTMLEVLGSDYIRTARAKGLLERTVLYKHALRNAMLPVVTVLGMSLGALLGGAVVIETVFARPGIGRLAVGALNGRDFPVTQGVVLVAALMFILANLVTDLSYGFIDPRVRYD